MLHLSFGHSFAELVALILLPGLALYFLNKKKASARKNEADAADTGAPGSLTAPAEANSDGSSSLPAETNNGASGPSPTETNSGAYTSSPTETNNSPPTATNSGGFSPSPVETKSGGSSSSPAEINKGASSSSQTETNGGTSNSLNASPGNCYEVFLSFRGPDTRHGFADHLYHGLRRVDICAFRDDDELCQGEDIRPKLTAAITNSKILIPIFSESYGTSSWCLNELDQIMKCKNDNGQMVLPVFYKVKPAEVRYQSGSFGKAFHEYEERLLKRPSFDPTSLEKWKKALGEVSTLYGYDADGYEADLVESIVRKVLRELKKNFELVLSENLVGIDRHVKEVMEVMDTKKSDATLFLGIHGMGGIGKTTLAKAIYNKISNQFEHRSYIADIRESWKRNGAHNLQNQLIYDISKCENEVRNEDEGANYISKFQGKKVLLLLDDVDDDVQLKHLAGKRDWFSSGSMIIITTRNEHILQNFGVDHTYDHKELDYNQSVILFCKHAFRKDSPPSEFEGLTHEVVSTTGGLPLSLEVVGSLLCGQKLAFWRDKIDKLKKVPPQKVQEKLRISYEVLEDGQKQIFLDIACFFIGTNRRIASYMWNACGFFPEEGIEVLRFMSLIKIGDYHELRMHDQLRDLGREIVREENRREPQNRSRLWDFEEVKKVLKKNKGTGKIEAIDLSEGSSKGFGKIVERDDNIYTGEQFQNLTSLRFLRMEEGAHLTGDFKDSVEELKWLRWESCPMNFEVNNFHATELVVLELRRGMINDGWEGWSSFKMADKLKVLNLTGCQYLENTDFLSAFKNLEVLILGRCSRLQQVDSSIGDMKDLVRLELWDCRSLTKLPEEIGKLKKVQQLLLPRTPKLSALPESIGHLENLEILNIAYSGIEELPRGIGRLRNLRELHAGGCKKLGGKLPESIGSLQNLKILNIAKSGIEELPDGIGRLRNLQELCVGGCKNLGGKLPESIGSLQNLKILNIAKSGIEELPDGIGRLRNLQELCVVGCENLRGKLPESIGSLQNLKILNISWSGIEELLDGIGKLTKLRELRAYGCKKLGGKLPESMGSLPNLEILNIGESGVEGLPHGIGWLRNLRVLHANGCKKLGGKLPESMGSLQNLEEMAKKLKYLDLSYCESLETTEFLSAFKNLEVLKLNGCSGLQQIDSSIGGMKALLCLELCNCRSLTRLAEEIGELKALQRLLLEDTPKLSALPESIGSLQNLKILNIAGSGIEELPDGIGRLRKLQELRASRCENLKGERRESMCNLSSLERLDFHSCKKLQRLPDLPSSLTYLGVTCRSRKLPSLSHLTRLKELKVICCEFIECIQELPSTPLKNSECSQPRGVEESELPQSLNTPFKLEILMVSGCKSIEILDVSQFIRLRILHVFNCENLLEVRGLDKLKYLGFLTVGSCDSVERLELPKLEDLKVVTVQDCENLVEIQGLDCLKNLNIDRCASIERLDLPKSGSMKILRATECAKLAEIQGVDSLESLSISNCATIERLDLPKYGSMKELHAKGCVNLAEIQGLDRLEFLEELNISKCASIETLNLSKSNSLKKLNAGYCESLVEIQGLGRLEFLEKLDLSGCTSFERLPNLCCFDYLESLTINGCDKLQDIQSLERFPSCKTLWIEGCKSLAKLPNLSSFHDLRELFLSNCHELREIPGLEESISLTCIAISGCSSIELLPDLSSCTRLKSLIVQDCEKLTELRGLEKLEQLAELDISGCKSLKTIPELSGTLVYQNYVKKLFACGRSIEFASGKSIEFASDFLDYLDE